MLIELWTLYFMCNLLEYFMDLYLWNCLLEYIIETILDFELCVQKNNS